MSLGHICSVPMTRISICYGTGRERQKAARKNNDKNTNGWQKALETRNRNDNPN